MLFAGEGTVDSTGGQQCTHGAFLSGVNSALAILDQVQGGRCRLRDVRIVDYLTGHRTYSFPPHSMIRRAMRRKTNAESLIQSSGKSEAPSEQETTSKKLRTEAAQNSQTDRTFPPVLCVSTGTHIRSQTNTVNCSSKSDLSIVPSRRSNRMSTWISSQASASLYSFYKVRRSGGSCEKRTRPNYCASSSSTSSLGSFKDESTPSPSSPEPSGDGVVDDEQSRVRGKLLTQPLLHTFPPVTENDKNPCINYELVQPNRDLGVSFGAPPVFRPPLPLMILTAALTSKKTVEHSDTSEFSSRIRNVLPDCCDQSPRLATTSNPCTRKKFSSEATSPNTVPILGSSHYSQKPIVPSTFLVDNSVLDCPHVTDNS